ncbi:MAG: hypothetical protein ACRC2H_12385 [Silanimonas sp.]
MARHRVFVWATGAAIVAALGGTLVWRSGSDVPWGAAVEAPADRSGADVAMPSVDRANAATDVAAPRAFADSPQARAALAAQAERLRFEKALRDFLAHSASLDAAERARIAAALDAQVEAEELAGRMSADEARMLRLALIERGTDDAAERRRRAEALAEAYRLEAERRQRAFEQQQANDPRFRDYKTREAQVVAEVMRLREIPGGLSRDEYLRRRLQAERERAYGGG